MKFLIARYNFFAGYRARTFSLTRYKFLARYRAPYIFPRAIARVRFLSSL